MSAENGRSPSPTEQPVGTRSLALHHRYDPGRRVVAVTGASGFLGSELIRRMEEDRRYARVLAIDIRKPGLPLTKTQFHKVDLTQPTADAAVARILKEQQADALAHLAFLSGPTHNRTWAHELEAIGTMHVLNACAACGLRKLILSSLTALYGPHPQNPNFLAEDAAPRGIPGSRFFEDKLEAERLTQRFADENPSSVVTVLRNAPILGRRARNYLSRYLALPVVPVMMGFDPLLQLLHEEDAVDALKLCVDADFPGTFNIAGDGVLPLSTILALAGKATVSVPHFLAYPLAKVLWMAQIFDVPPTFLDFMRYLCVADATRSKVALGFRPKHDIRKIVTEFAGTSLSAATAATGAR